NHAIRLEVLEIFAEGVGGVEAVLAQRESASGGRGPGVHQRHLDDVILGVRISHERPAVGDVDVDLGAVVQVIGVVGVALAHHRVGDDRIDLDPGHVRTATGYGAQHVHATARTYDGKVSARAQHIG